jgi:prophage regulatory protein
MTPILCDVDRWVGTAEIMRMFGISRQRTYQLTSRKDFPAPMVKLKAGAVWVTADVIAWAESKGREIRED